MKNQRNTEGKQKILTEKTNNLSTIEKIQWLEMNRSNKTSSVYKKISKNSMENKVNLVKCKMFPVFFNDQILI